MDENGWIEKVRGGSIREIKGRGGVLGKQTSGKWQWRENGRKDGGMGEGRKEGRQPTSLRKSAILFNCDTLHARVRLGSCEATRVLPDTAGRDSGIYSIYISLSRSVVTRLKEKRCRC